MSTPPSLIGKMVLQMAMLKLGDKFALLQFMGLCFISDNRSDDAVAVHVIFLLVTVHVVDFGDIGSLWCGQFRAFTSPLRAL